MKQKIVIRLSMNNDKCHCKALKIAVCVAGVESAAITGKEKNQVEVVGDGVDSVELTRRLRKKVACADLVSVEEFKKKEETKDGGATALAFAVGPPWCYGYPQGSYCEIEPTPRLRRGQVSGITTSDVVIFYFLFFLGGDSKFSVYRFCGQMI